MMVSLFARNIPDLFDSESLTKMVQRVVPVEWIIFEKFYFSGTCIYTGWSELKVWQEDFETIELFFNGVEIHEMTVEVFKSPYWHDMPNGNYRIVLPDGDGYVTLEYIPLGGGLEQVRWIENFDPYAPND